MPTIETWDDLPAVAPPAPQPQLVDVTLDPEKLAKLVDSVRGLLVDFAAARAVAPARAVVDSDPGPVPPAPLDPPALDSGLVVDALAVALQFGAASRPDARVRDLRALLAPSDAFDDMKLIDVAAMLPTTRPLLENALRDWAGEPPAGADVE